jgi:hypothetical protein
MTRVYSVLMSHFLVASVSPPPVDSAPPSPEDSNTSQQHANAPSNDSTTDPDVRSAPAPSTEISGSSSLSNPTFGPNIFPNLTIRGSRNRPHGGESHLVLLHNLLINTCMYIKIILWNLTTSSSRDTAQPKSCHGITAPAVLSITHAG